MKVIITKSSIQILITTGLVNGSKIMSRLVKSLRIKCYWTFLNKTKQNMGPNSFYGILWFSCIVYISHGELARNNLLIFRHSILNGNQNLYSSFHSDSLIHNDLCNLMINFLNSRKRSHCTTAKSICSSTL
jgi:hypothetical protein